MIEIFIDGLTPTESNIDNLLQARKVINGEIRARAEQELYNLKQREKELQDMLASPATATPVVSITPGKAPKSVNPMKYCNPANPDQQWTGRGKPPAWFDRDNPTFVAGYAKANAAKTTELPLAIDDGDGEPDVFTVRPAVSLVRDDDLLAA